jgi:hypothetical protein
MQLLGTNIPRRGYYYTAGIFMVALPILVFYPIFSAGASSISNCAPSNVYEVAQAEPLSLATTQKLNNQAQQVSLSALRKGISRSLSADQTHSYHFTLKANRYVHIALTPKGIDVTLTLYGPNGTKLEYVYLPQSTESYKYLMWDTKISGMYRLEVRARESTAAGTYAVILRRALPIIQRYKSLIIADRLTSEGWRLHEIGTEEALRQAIPKFTEAIPHWQAVGDAKEEATALMYLGESYNLLCEYQNEPALYERALRLWKTLPADVRL